MWPRFSYNVVILTILSFGYFVFYFAIVGISVLAPEIIKDESIKINQNDIGMIIFVSGLVRLPEKLISGFLADVFNQKWLYIICGIGKHLFVILFSQSSDFTQFIIFWSMQEIIWGPIWPCNVKIINNWFDKYHIATAMGMLNLSYLFGDGIIRGIIGLLLYYGFYWRTIMLSCGIIGIGYLIIIFIFLKNKPTDNYIWMFCQKKNDEQSVIDTNVIDDHSPLLLIPDPTIKNTNLSKMWKKHWKPLIINPCFWILFFTVSTISFARYTLFYWTPFYLVYVGASDSFAAMGSLIFPFAGGIGAVIIGIIDDRMDTEYKKNIVMFIFFICSSICLFFLWLIQDQNWQNIPNILVMYGLIGFFLLSSYTLPSGVMSIRFGQNCSGNAASLLEFAGGIAMALSGLMSKIISDNNNWTLIWYICLLSSICSVVSLFLFVSINHRMQN